MADDASYMLQALELAEQGLGLTSPNPMVGCVIVKKGQVIAEGWHKVCGGDHAEVVALMRAGTRAKGATMYVTLEPCAHWGRTPPCVDAVLKAGIKRVVIAMKDPNPLVSGRSVAKLKKAGVEVVTGVCEEQSRRMNAAFIKYITTRLPYVTAKTAQTLDGRIATRMGDSKWITSGQARELARGRRNRFDAIMVGIKTVLCDDPSLNAPDKRIKKVIVDSRLSIPENAKLFNETISGQVIVACTRKAPAAKIRRLEQKGVEVLVCPQGGTGVDLPHLFKALAKKEIASILIEGGAALIGSALKAGLVDELNVYIAPRIMGDEKARPSVAGLLADKVSDALNFTLDGAELVGPDVCLILTR